MSDGPAIPARSFQVADQSAHDGFHMLSGILSAEGVDVLCDFLRLPEISPIHTMARLSLAGARQVS